MRPPLFVDGDDGLLIFQSAGKLAASLEPEDVRAGVYGAVFDWEGHRLELSAVEERRRGLGAAPLVVVDEPEDPELDAEGLRELLDRALGAMGEVESLDELRRLALERFGLS